MKHFTIPSSSNRFLISHAKLMAESFQRLLGQSLLSDAKTDDGHGPCDAARSTRSAAAAASSGAASSGAAVAARRHDDDDGDAKTDTRHGARDAARGPASATA